MPDEFEQIRTALQRNGQISRGGQEIPLLLDNQRVIMATLATLVRGGRVPIETARDLHERAKKITAILDG